MSQVVEIKFLANGSKMHCLNQRSDNLGLALQVLDVMIRYSYYIRIINNYVWFDNIRLFRPHYQTLNTMSNNSIVRTKFIRKHYCCPISHHWTIYSWISRGYSLRNCNISKTILFAVYIIVSYTTVCKWKKKLFRKFIYNKSLCIYIIFLRALCKYILRQYYAIVDLKQEERKKNPFKIF